MAHRQEYVTPGRVVTTGIPSKRDIEKMKAVLTRQGQIEPLQVKEHGINFKTFEQDAWADEIVHAASELRWPTILVLVTDRFIE